MHVAYVRCVTRHKRLLHLLHALHVANALLQAGFKRVQLIPWSLAEKAPQAQRGRHLLFPASGLARKGAYAVRRLAQDLGLPLIITGQAEEEKGFWSSEVLLRRVDQNIFRGIGCLVLPAYVEHQPRLLLQAAARGLPVICSPECGLSPRLPGIKIVPAGDEQLLKIVVASCLNSLAPSPAACNSLPCV